MGAGATTTAAGVGGGNGGAQAAITSAAAIATTILERATVEILLSIGGSRSSVLHALLRLNGRGLVDGFLFLPAGLPLGVLGPPVPRIVDEAADDRLEHRAEDLE